PPRRDRHIIWPRWLAALVLLPVPAICAALGAVVVLRGALTIVPRVSRPCGGGGQVIVGVFEEPDTLLPLLTHDDDARIVEQALWAPLWYGDGKGVLHAGIAAIPSQGNGDISPDLQTWTIRLRGEPKWSDTSPLTAADLAFSLQLYADPA